MCVYVYFAAKQTPHAPQLHTATRADQRLPPVPVSHEQEKPAQGYSCPKLGGLTQVCFRNERFAVTI